MAHIYVYSPSGAVRDRAAFRRGERRLQQMGHEVEVDPDALASYQRFAGDDAVRPGRHPRRRQRRRPGAHHPAATA